MVKLPAGLVEPRKPLRAIATGWLLAFPVSLVLAVLAQKLFPQAEGPTFDVQGPAAIILLVLFAPFVETLIMAAVIELMLRLRVPAYAAIPLSAIGWGAAHSSAAPAWGLVIWWPFLIFSTLYVTWTKRSVWAAIGIVTVVHALQNLGPALLLVSGI